MRQLFALILLALAPFPAQAQDAASTFVPMPTRAPRPFNELSFDRSPAPASPPAAVIAPKSPPAAATAPTPPAAAVIAPAPPPAAGTAPTPPPATAAAPALPPAAAATAPTPPPAAATAPPPPVEVRAPPASERPSPQTASISATAPPAPPESPRALNELPLDSGLPVVVRAGLAFIDVDGIDENREIFPATVDLRLSWVDLRLRFPAEDAPIGYREWRGDAVTAQLETMWSPEIGLANLRGEPTRQSRSLRLYPDGRVELLRRVTGTFGSQLDVRRFPFDRQQLQAELVSQDETADKVILDYRQDDLLFSRADPGIEIAGWTVASINLIRAPLSGWYGESYSRLRVALEVDRRAIETVPALFVPLLASLLIPLLAVWLNRSKNGEFEIKAFELTNIVIGGLFAIIALNFTINSERSILASSANTVSLLFGLNYLALAAALVINVCLFRFNVVRVLAGRHVQQETVNFIIWALPVAVIATAAALILIAAA
jgi:neurotransmitter-gated ion-channel